MSPIIDASLVARSSENKSTILVAFARDAGLAVSSNAEYISLPPKDWYFVAKAGFNFVDDQCRSYFHQLFFLNRNREQFKSGILAAGQTASAIMGVTGASSVSLAVLAQAIGLGVNTTDLLAGTYLYQLPPAVTQNFVVQLQSTFRDAAADKRDLINSPEAAYYMIQRYLDLCLPPRIEAEITRQIGAVSAVPVRQGEGSFFTLETVSATRDLARQTGVYGEVRPRPSGRETFTQNPTAEQRCKGDDICLQLTRYLMPGPAGKIRVDRREQMRGALEKIDPSLKDKLLTVIRADRYKEARLVLLKIIKDAQIP
ncbi:hypothetical protein [Bosea sp. 685]|uniref:hypothetical protein n=1 Tax=Bosea sp. 685 TaxID=3080057 RepID=UPI002893518A|nr:hypothetical protein [Bosea sp. 685]WNJ89587.1 hypothetical protein RMR04_24770 [Bosea sp. 685]